MKVMRCNKCNKNQGTGKFCLDCGSLLVEIITSNIKFMPIQSSRPAERIKQDIRSWLFRIGVQQGDITISSRGGEAIIDYLLNKKKYQFRSHMQDSITNNLAAVEQFLHARVLGIERGIETTEQAFAGYEALPDFNIATDPYEILGVTKDMMIDQIRSRFKELAKKFHPDVNSAPGADLQFQRIKRALEDIEYERSQ